MKVSVPASFFIGLSLGWIEKENYLGVPFPYTGAVSLQLSCSKPFHLAPGCQLSDFPL
jgi:hypothetical protein